ncbi:MAG: helix-turn-helix domain-containing protein [Clostridiales bacterium]|jgi:AraC-like DNA-binding protein|nr:helix-turn-helix domain-containing protein [Clostridiales bacterium]
MAFDTQIKQLNSFAAQVSLNQYFRDSYRGASPGAEFDIMRYLNEFASTNQFVGEVLFCRSDAELFFSSRATYDPDILFNKIYPYQGWDSARFRALPAALNAPDWIGDSPVVSTYIGNNRISTYLVPVRRDDIGPGQRPILMFLIPRSAISRILNLAPGGAVQTIIESADGQIVYSSADSPGFLNPAAALDKDRWEELKTDDGTRAYGYRSVSPETGLTYTTIILQTYLLENVVRMQQVCAAVFGLFLLLGAGSVLYAGKLSYRPIGRLSQSFRAIGLQDEDETALIEKGRSALLELYNSNLEFQRERLLIDLLSGAPTEKNEREGVWPLFSEHGLRVLILKVLAVSVDGAAAYSDAANSDAANSDAANSDAANPRAADAGPVNRAANSGAAMSAVAEAVGRLPKPLSCHIIHSLEQNRFILVVSEAADGAEGTRMAAEALLRAVGARGVRAAVAMGGLCQSIVFLRRSLSEAELAIAYKASLAPGEIVVYDASQGRGRGAGTLAATAAAPEKKRRGGRPENLGDAIAEIDARFSDPDFSIKMLAADMNMTVSNLSHQFKSRVGISITEYIQRSRMLYARQLLESGEYSVAEVAEMVGYLHTSSFIRQFKQTTEQTPGSYLQDKQTPVRGLQDKPT